MRRETEPRWCVGARTAATSSNKAAGSTGICQTQSTLAETTNATIAAAAPAANVPAALLDATAAVIARPTTNSRNAQRRAKPTMPTSARVSTYSECALVT